MMCLKSESGAIYVSHDLFLLRKSILKIIEPIHLKETEKLSQNFVFMLFDLITCFPFCVLAKINIKI